MKKMTLAVAAMAVLASAALGSMVPSNLSIYTDGDWDGWSYNHGTGSNNTGAMFFTGDPHTVNAYACNGIVKYELSSALTGQTITDATVNLRVIQHYVGDHNNDNTVYVLLQKYTFDNNTPVNNSDGNETRVENIGVFSAGPGAWMSWDVTSQLQDDLDAGFTYSSYRTMAVESPTDLTPVIMAGAYYVNIAAAELTGTYPWPGLEPRLDVEYVPEPVSLALILGGVLYARKRQTSM